MRLPRRVNLGHGGVVPKGKEAPKKAVLISGPPGIGKTSAAKIICRTLGFDVLEVNASDSRGKVRRRPARPHVVWLPGVVRART